MDKFVVKLSAPQRLLSPSKTGKLYKQMKIENLKGVVVIEDLERAKVILEREDTASSLMVKTLNELLAKRPAKEILVKTKLGKTVHKLCRHSDEEIASHAKKVYTAWRNHVTEAVDRPSIEVRCDLKTRQLRDKARSFIAASLSEHDSSETKSQNKTHPSSSDNSCKTKASDVSPKIQSLADYIEREVFKVAKNRTTHPYRRATRKIWSALKYRKEITAEVLQGEITVQQLVKKYFES